MDPIEIKIRLNVDKEQAEELYDEIESYLSLCFETLVEKDRNMASLLGQQQTDKILRVITPPALTGFLIEKLGNSLIKVENVELFNDVVSFVTGFHISITVPTLWAINYGKAQIDERLNDAISFFRDKPIEAVKKLEKLSTSELMRQGSDAYWNSTLSQADQKSTPNSFNGLPCSPLIGSIYYDQLRHCMKRWDGSKWHDA